MPSLGLDLALTMGTLQWVLAMLVTGVGALVLFYCAWYFSDDDPGIRSFAGTLTAACFLSEQFYLPVWLLVALGVALDPGPVASEYVLGKSWPSRASHPSSASQDADAPAVWLHHQASATPRGADGAARSRSGAFPTRTERRV